MTIFKQKTGEKMTIQVKKNELKKLVNTAVDEVLKSFDVFKNLENEKKGFSLSVRHRVFNPHK